MKKAPVWMIVRARKASEVGSAKSGSTLTTAMVLASKGGKVDPEDGLLDLSPGSWAAVVCGRILFAGCISKTARGKASEWGV